MNARRGSRGATDFIPGLPSIFVSPPEKSYYCFMAIYRLQKDPVFPDPRLADEDGLLAIGGDLSADRLLQAYANGIFPWYDARQPILWWSPDPRIVIEPKSLHLSRSLKRTLKSMVYRVSFDTAFAEVITQCALTPRKGENGTWITREMRKAYIHLHELGYAHSVECWRNDTLAGGLYGISLGSSFFGESMFSKATDASKTALAALCAHMNAWDMPLLDCQVPNPHLKSLGAVEIPREEFLHRLREGMQSPTRQGKWQLDNSVWGVKNTLAI